jgi:hypothetical protein
MTCAFHDVFPQYSIDVRFYELDSIFLNIEYFIVECSIEDFISIHMLDIAYMI